MQRARRAVEAKLQWSSATADRLAAERVERARMCSPAQTHNLLIEELLLDAHHPDLTMHDQETALFEDAIAEQRDEDDDLELLTDLLSYCWGATVGMFQERRSFPLLSAIRCVLWLQTSLFW